MRTAKKQANIENLRKLVVNNGVTDNRQIIAVVMRESGCTLQEVANVMQFSRQMADTMVKKAQTTLEVHYEI